MPPPQPPLPPPYIEPKAPKSPELKLWFTEIKMRYKGTTTEVEYIRYNNAFQSWFARKYGKNAITEAAIREYIFTYIEAGKNTGPLISALSFRFNECEKMNLSFKGLVKESEHKKGHKVLPEELRIDID